MGFPMSHQPRFYAAPNFLKMGMKPCKCATTLVANLPAITGKAAWNWRHAVLSADAGLLVRMGRVSCLRYRYRM